MARFTAALLRGTIVGALGGFLFGYDTVVISGATAQLTQVFSLSPASLGVTVSIALWGTVAGCLLAGWLGTRLGGRNALRVMATLYVVSAVGCALAWSWPTLLVFRLIGGLGIGGSSVLGPVYISELAPAAWRGRLVGTFQMMVVTGILIAYVANWHIARLGLGAAEWRWQLGAAGFPACLFFVMLYTIPHSSRFLISRNNIGPALRVLQQMGITDSDGELKLIRASLAGDAANSQKRLFKRSLRLPIMLAITIGVFNQLSGINAILYYANDIFTAAGLSRLSSFSQSIYIGVANLLATILGMSLIDRIGRKTLLLIGAAGTMCCLFTVGVIFQTRSYLASLVWVLIGFIAFFAVSQGAVIWVYISEVFPTSVRSKGQSLGSLSHWLMNAVIAGLFPIVAARLSPAIPFYLFAIAMLVQLIVVANLYPETKGKSLERLQIELQR